MPRNCSSKPNSAGKTVRPAQSGAGDSPLRPGLLCLCVLLLSLLLSATAGAAEPGTADANAPGVPNVPNVLGSPGQNPDIDPQEREYPLKSVSLALPFASTDQQQALITLLQPYLWQTAEETITTQNFPGRGGGYAWGEIVGKEAQGYALAFLAMPSFQLQAMPKNHIYARTDITPVCILAYAPAALWVPSDSPIKSLDDLITLGRKAETPLLLSGTGSYTDQHVTALLFARAAGIGVQYLPYTSSETAAKAAKDKTTVACWGYAFAPESMPGMRPLAVAHQERSPALPETATFLELGVDLVSGQFIGVGMPFTEDTYTAGLVSEFFISASTRAGAMAKMFEAGYIPTPVPFANLAPKLEQMDTDIETFLQNYQMFPKQ